MVKIANVSDIALAQYEYCFLKGDQYFNSSSFHVKIPKLMPSVTPKQTEPFNKNILVNASTCKPSVNGSIKVQDYVTIKRSRQCSLYHKIGNIKDEVLDGTGVTCLCMNNNYKDIRIIDSL